MKKYFISGLVFLLPIAITLAIINFMIGLLTTPFQSCFNQLLNLIGINDHNLPIQIINISILIGLFFTTLAVGIIVRSYFSKKIIQIGEYLIARVPLISSIYKASQDVIHTCISSPGASFKQVVLVTFPNSKSHSLGFLIKESPKACSNSLGEEKISIFVPTAPNPTTGFIMMFSKEDILLVDISVEEAFKYIISCGMITPEISQKPKP